MAGVNKAIVVGHLGGDPDVRKTQAGSPVVSFSVATSESWKDKATGERKEHTDWHRVVIFNEGLCKVAEQYLKKGSKVYLEGKMQTRDWTDQSGVKKYVTEVVLAAFGSQLVLLDRAERAPNPEPDSYGSNSSAPGASRAAAPASGKRPDLDDEIPF